MDSEQSTQLYKVIWRDGYGRESVAERLIADNLSHSEALALCEKLRTESQSDSDWWLVKRQEYTLWRGVEEFI